VPQGSHWSPDREGQPDDPEPREARPSQKTCLPQTQSSLSRKEDALATNRPRPIIATLVALLALSATSVPPAAATSLRVEGPTHTIFQGRVKPFVGTLKGHTTTHKTALGALVTASRKTPFQLGLSWNDSFGGAWKGFFVTSIAGITPPTSAFWALKVGQTSSLEGIGSTRVGRDTKVLMYYTTYDPVSGATQPTLGLAASTRTPEPNTSVTFTVKSYDDTGTGTADAAAWVWMNGVASHANAGGKVTVRLARGRYHVRATSPGAIRSRTLWVRAS
jgi:hypothetical protein